MLTISRRRVFFTGAGALLTTSLSLKAATMRVAVNDTGTAIDGYDTTAYWNVSEPRKGTSNHAVTWNGVEWWFSSAKDAQRFNATPEAFAPQFGGYCTRAMSFNKIVNGDPEVWRIYQGKLYLFALPVGGRKFDKGQDAMIAKAQAYWDTLS